MTQKYEGQDTYSNPDTGVLYNKLGINNADELERIETDVVSIRQFEARKNAVGQGFDLNHLKAIHHHLFQDVYAWAGELRTIDITKGNSRFAAHHYIEGEANKLFQTLPQEDYLQGLSDKPLVERLAHYTAEINALHPFREGNGRAQREFISQLANTTGHDIRWVNISKDEMLSAAIKSFHGDNGQLEAILSNHTVQLAPVTQEDTGRQRLNFSDDIRQKVEEQQATRLNKSRKPKQGI